MPYKKILLGDIAEFSQGKQVSIDNQYTFKERNMKRFIRIVDYTDINESPRFIKDCGDRYYVSDKEVAMIRYGSQTAGKVVMGKNGIIANNLFKISVDNEEALDKYIYYYLSQPQIFNYLRKTQSSSTMPAISFNTLRKLEIKIPDLVTQNKIVHVLSSFDQKIELNNQQNKSIEKQASDLVQKYINNEKGTVELKDIMSFDNGFAFKSKDYVDSGRYKVITIKNVQDGLIDSSSAQFIKDYPKDMRECHKLSSGDALLSLTGNVGRVGIVFEENLLLNQRVAKLKPKNEKLSPFLYFLFRQKDFKQKLEALAKGTAQLNLSPIEALEQAIPFSEQSALILSEKLGPLYEKIIINNRGDKTLSAIRDSLLPKLMSGEIDLGRISIND